AVMAKWFTFHQAAMTSEETIRSIVRSATPGTYSIKPEAVPRIEFARLYKEVLRAATLSQHQEFFDIMRETRNTIHTNGFYSPPDGRPKSFSYRGQTLDFIPGRGLEWLNDTLAIQLVHDLGDRMFEIVVAKPAVDFAYCPGSAGALPLPVVEGESE
ncbi:MAG: hypothetical protein HY678_07025, partial [Chloroflexi bacterium]|nr:hypothetical protein [Chloroflexota bacterium]